MPAVGTLAGRFGYGLPAPAPAPAPSGLVTSGLFVHLDASNAASYPGSGTIWTDLTGNGNTGTLTNGPVYSALAGGCIDCDGTNDFISITSNSSLLPTTATPITMQIWVYFDSLATGGAIINKLTGSFGFDGYIVSVTTQGYAGYTVNGTGVNQVQSTNPTVVFTTGTWYLVTFITQRTATANTTRLYVNTTVRIQNAWGNDGYSESNPLQLGGGYAGFTNCKIGAFYFYTRGLSDSEITQNFNATKSRYGL
jgi:hypothetical protein